MATSFSTVTVAVQLAERGYGVFPTHTVVPVPVGALACSCGDETCDRKGKHPACYYKEAAARTRGSAFEAGGEWRMAWTPSGVSPNLGIATGHEYKLVVVDVDLKDDGYRSLYDLEQKLGPLPETVTVITGSGGRHFYFEHEIPPIRQSISKLAPGIDVKGEGNYVVGPGSLHASGNRYFFHPRFRPSLVPLAPLPQTWIDALLALRDQDGKASVPDKSRRQGAHVSDELTPHPVARALLRAMLLSPVSDWMQEVPDEVSRSTWIGVAANLAAAVKGHPDLEDFGRLGFHELSEGYTGYSYRQTDREWAYALSHGKPTSWAAMDGIPGHHVVPGTKNLLHAARIALRQQHK